MLVRFLFLSFACSFVCVCVCCSANYRVRMREGWIEAVSQLAETYGRIDR